jgi:hypothetical protein
MGVRGGTLGFQTAGKLGERCLTADPNSPLHPIPPGSLGAKLPSSEGAGSSTAAMQPEGNQYAGVELWLRRLAVLMFVFVCATVGVFLVILPWRPEWTDNHLLLAYPALRAFVANGFVRGVCTGLGVLDIWIGFSEAIHYHEDKRP